MKTITVNVQIQMDVEDNKSVLSQVQDILEVVNDVISNNEIDGQPQIFVNDIDNSDINEMPY
jgi:hypothetical protein